MTTAATSTTLTSTLITGSFLSGTCPPASRPASLSSTRREYAARIPSSTGRLKAKHTRRVTSSSRSERGNTSIASAIAISPANLLIFLQSLLETRAGAARNPN